ncbi:heme uptake protein IsdC [Alkalicoccobacillus murimartini]|uniref:Heme uptake protein IsdC n=1 Tax=Alkalicoccobacillus murimartini TaxID=171685 RepID=A0ABT9YIQ7_9BACI|nr:heme uptake protein IsdC [Alkalicoccobacillus murimartini]MDQ0207743.1 heme uptake protein IsdC [Alkalicoccobacillus murimartini]
MKVTSKISLMTIVMLLITLLVTGPGQAHAQLEDGTYTISYTVMHGQDPSASIANDYWEKPATLYVENGEITAEMGLNHSSWIVEFQTARNGGFSDVSVISVNEQADTSVTQFPINGISDMTEAKIHVIVPDIDYDHSYTIRFDFDETTLTSTGGNSEDDKKEETNEDSKEDGELLGTTQPSDDNKQTTDQSESKTSEKNPQTSDQTPVFLLMSLAIVSAIVLLRKRVTQV